MRAGEKLRWGGFERQSCCDSTLFLGFPSPGTKVALGLWIAGGTQKKVLKSGEEKGTGPAGHGLPDRILSRGAMGAMAETRSGIVGRSSFEAASR